MSRFVAGEREQFADLLGALGPDAPTLCVGWRTRELAAHLVLRERRPDTVPGIVVRPLSRWTGRVLASTATRPWPWLVDRVRHPAWWLRAGSADDLVNLTEYFVHHEDVRRAQDGWEPRVLDAAYAEALWRRLTRVAPLLYRRSPAPVRLRLPDGRSVQARGSRGERTDGAGDAIARPAEAPGPSNAGETAAARPGAAPARTVTGDVGELLMHAFGRTDRALVTVR